jgi:sulfite dehydrogenase
MVLQCSGNGRKFFAHGPSGTKWDTGSAACVIFSGVSVKYLAELCGGLTAGAKFITGTGADVPKGIDPKEGAVERSVPISTYEDCLLAWEVNGVPIQNAHGGPLRLVVPGYYGINNIKHVNKLVFADKESDFKMMSTRYRVYKIGNKATANDGTCWEMNVKSWITTPLTTAKTGKVVFTGVAFSNGTPLKGVALSFDEGKNWKAAKFVGPNLGKFAWRQFQFEANLEKGNYTVASRATDEKGSQPKLRFENNEGYSHNGWLDHSVKITVA